MRASVARALLCAMLLYGCGQAGLIGDPTVKPTDPGPVPTPTPRITAVPLDMSATEFTATAARGATAKVSVKTIEAARCTIEVLYNSGPSKAAGLEPKSSSSGGTVIWSWTVGFNTTAGTYPVTIVCEKGARDGVLELQLTVTE